MSMRGLRRGTMARRAAAAGKSYPATGGNTYLVAGKLEIWMADAMPGGADGVWFHSSWSAAGSTVYILPVSGSGANSIYRSAATTHGWVVGDIPKQDAVNGRAQWRSVASGMIGTVMVGAVLADPG